MASETSLTGTFGPTEIAVPRARLVSQDGKASEWKSQSLRGLSAPHSGRHGADCFSPSVRHQHAAGAPRPDGVLRHTGSARVHINPEKSGLSYRGPLTAITSPVDTALRKARVATSGLQVTPSLKLGAGSRITVLTSANANYQSWPEMHLKAQSY
jgi:hypothetical protein